MELIVFTSEEAEKTPESYMLKALQNLDKNLNCTYLSYEQHSWLPIDPTSQSHGPLPVLLVLLSAEEGYWIPRVQIVKFISVAYNLAHDDAFNETSAELSLSGLNAGLMSG
mgnify:CR=1 FL=1